MINEIINPLIEIKEDTEKMATGTGAGARVIDDGTIDNIDGVAVEA